MLFETDEYMMEEGKIDISEEQYPYLINDIIKYIDEIKKNDKSAVLIDIILDYTFKNGIDISAISDAITSDEYFKSFIEKDCESRNILKHKTVEDVW
jgi:hypothetical protein